MNRKLRNTILAFSVTGTVLALGLIAARPVTPDALQQPAVAASAGPSGEAMEAGERPQAQDSAAPAAEYGVNDDVQARSLARSRQFEDEIARTASLDLSIGLISSLNHWEEVLVPSLPLLLMKTAAPPDEVWPKMLPI